MAVTKIRRISSWTLLAVSIISLIILGIFFGGGVVDPTVEMQEPKYTGLLINWMYVLFIGTITVTIIMAIWQFVSILQTNPKSALTSLVVLVAFAIILFITYSVGDATPLKGLNADSQEFNIPFWLKITDMWILSSAVLLVLIIIALAVGSIKNALNR